MNNLKPLQPGGRDPDEGSRPSRLLPAILAAAILLILVGLLFKPTLQKPAKSASPIGPNFVASMPASQVGSLPRRPSSRQHEDLAPPQTAQEIVAGKLSKFGRMRRDVVHAIAKRLDVPVPDDVERFFEAVESGRWEDIDAAHKALLLPDNGLNQPRSAELHQIWRPIQEAWGAAREAHNWSAQRLLDYGN